MNGIKKTLITLLLSYLVVTSVNIIANYPEYAAGADWRFSILFSVAVITVGWAGYILLDSLFFRKIMNWERRPNATLLFSVLISGLYGIMVMALAMKSLVWFFDMRDQPLYDYVNNSMYAVLFAMLIGLAINGQEFLNQWKKSAEENDRMKQELLRSQYEMLKSQVNPHFFFNSLNTLSNLIPENPEVAGRFVNQLSKVFRYSLQNRQEQSVSVETELDIVQSYLFINQQRFGSKLVVNVEIDKRALPLHIITHSLLTLVENCIKHNEISFANPLSVHIYNDNDEYLVVENTYRPKALSEISMGIGLPNIVDRYRLVTDKSIIIQKENGLFTVKIPLLK